MEKSELEKLVPEKSFVMFAGSPYRYAGYQNHFGAIMVEIYDEPPSEHIDLIRLSSLDLVDECEKCSGPCEQISGAEAEMPYKGFDSNIILLKCTECHHEFEPINP